jgi:hypothetical protein
VVQFDRLIARTDSRLIVKGWVESRFPSLTAIAQIGPPAGHVFQYEGDEVPYIPAEITPTGRRPAVVIVQNSPMRSAPDLSTIGPILEREYELAFVQEVARGDPRNVYDRQDEFYVPLAGFTGIERPGPNLRVYVRRN